MFAVAKMKVTGRWSGRACGATSLANPNVTAGDGRGPML